LSVLLASAQAHDLGGRTRYNLAIGYSGGRNARGLGDSAG
jgi:hypothetical protein